MGIGNYKLFLFMALMLSCQQILGQSRVDFNGQWVNVNDSSEHLTLGTNGEFRLITHDVYNNEHNRNVGHWMYKRVLKRKFFLFPEHLPRRYFVVKKRGILGYTLKERKGQVIYARRALLPGDMLPRVGQPTKEVETRSDWRSEY